jgi:hypothetical protein
MLLPEYRTKLADQYEEYNKRFNQDPSIEHFIEWLEQSREGQEAVLKMHFELMQKLVYDTRKLKKILKEGSNGQ